MVGGGVGGGIGIKNDNDESSDDGDGDEDNISDEELIESVYQRVIDDIKKINTDFPFSCSFDKTEKKYCLRVCFTVFETNNCNVILDPITESDMSGNEIRTWGIYVYRNKRLISYYEESKLDVISIMFPVLQRCKLWKIRLQKPFSFTFV
jgi:hypothetical protein